MLLAACGLAASAALKSRAATAQLSTVEVASGVHFRRGVDEDAAPSNDDAIANIGFVVGGTSVAVIDPGGSLRDGERLRARIRAVTALPIRFVVVTHAHPDHFFGAGAFQQDGCEFVGHARLPQALAQRGEYYQRRLDEILGKGASGPVVSPTRTVAAQERLDLGGRTLALTAHPPAHSDCDLSVVDESSGTLMAGDLVFLQRIPSLEGSLKGWIEVLKKLQASGAGIRRVVPGHGPVGVKWPAGAGPTERYLRALQAQTRAAVHAGKDIDAAVATVGRSERGRWKLFDAYNGHNVTQAFKEVEWE
jgi:quinoprotein relay system zinc metallohydrolase 2